MNTASFELCKELFERSGWDETDFNWHKNYDDESQVWVSLVDGANGVFVCPAYDLGYLVRKLYASGPVLRLDLEARPDAGRDRYFIWVLQESIDIRVWADTPEDAAAKLVIELFKQGALKSVTVKT